MRFIILSEQAKLVYLQERIRRARLAIHSCAGVLAWGIVLTIFGFIFFSLFAFLLIIGVLLLLGGGATYFTYVHQLGELMQQLREMATVHNENKGGDMFG